MRGRDCGWCSHPDLQQFESRVAAGEPISVVALATPYSATAARRHVRLHMRPRLRAEMAQVGAAVNLSDFVERLMELTDQAATVRSYAVATNNGRLALQAIQQESALLVTLMDRLGIESTEVVEEFHDARAIVAAVGQAIRSGQVPQLAPTLAAALTSEGRPQLAQSLIETAAHLKGQNT